MTSLSQSAQRIIDAVPDSAHQLKPFELYPVLRELSDAVRELKESIKSLSSPDQFQSLTRREAAALLKVHPQEISRYEILGLPFYRMGKGHRYIRHEILSFREMLRNMAGLTLKISKPREKANGTRHSLRHLPENI